MKPRKIQLISSGLYLISSDLILISSDLILISSDLILISSNLILISSNLILISIILEIQSIKTHLILGARCERFDVVVLLIASRVAALTAEVLKLETVYNKDQGSDVTDLLEALDDRRDKAINGIKQSSEGLSNSNEKTKATAANLVFESIKKHRPGIARLNNVAETAVLGAIILEWKNSTALTAALATLDFTSWAAELKEANTLYSSTHQDRIDDKLETEGDSFSALRPNTLEVYKTLCNGIAAHYELDKNPEHLKLINAINLIIEEYNLILNKRDGSKDDDDDSGDGDGTDGE